MTDALLITDASGLALLITAACSGIVAILGAAAGAYVMVRNPIKTVDHKVEAVNGNVEQLKHGVEEVKVVVDKVHALTNGAMTEQLEGTALALRQNAISTRTIYGMNSTVANRILAETAERLATEAEERYRVNLETQHALMEPAKARVFTISVPPEDREALARHLSHLPFVSMDADNSGFVQDKKTDSILHFRPVAGSQDDVQITVVRSPGNISDAEIKAQLERDVAEMIAATKTST